MAVYNVSYDLLRPGQDYKDLINEIKSSSGWIKCLKSTWMISTNETAHQVWERLGRHIDTNDRLLISPVYGQSAGWMDQSIWDWINNQVAQYA